MPRSRKAPLLAAGDGITDLGGPRRGRRFPASAVPAEAVRARMEAEYGFVHDPAMFADS
ncbi:MAG: hypothetical protein WDN72_08930 [Alphaproteobacteria bacterium]